MEDLAVVHDRSSVTVDPRVLSTKARVQILKMCAASGAAHIAASLSCVDILSVLYAESANVSPERAQAPDRDVVVVSKGHAAAATYAVLAETGFFPVGWLEEYGMDDSPLGGHVTSAVPGVELSTGSLGHGLPYGAGVALGHQRKRSSVHVFVVVSDGECDEGTTWESALFAAHHQLGNLTVLIDRNGLQSLAGTEETLRLEPLADKWRAFGWQALLVNGHDHDAIARGIQAARLELGRPTVLICETVKGKGVSFMEDQVLWHYRPPTREQALVAIEEILRRGAL
jgi:transketolase